MNPLHYGSVEYSSNALSENQEPPRTTAEKIGREMNKMAARNEQNHLEQRLWRLEQEGGTAIRLLSEEIDTLNAKIEQLSPKTGEFVRTK